MGDDAGGLAFVPAEFHDDPAETRRSVERLTELDFDVLCLDHGRPVTDDPHAAIEALLSARLTDGSASSAAYTPARRLTLSGPPGSLWGADAQGSRGGPE